MRKIVPAALAAALLVSLPATASAIPAWARKYNMNCSGCHAPAAPRLNAKGLMFRWAGYRMPEEIGEKQEVKNISETMAARLRVRYAFSETEKSSPSRSEFVFNDATLFASGSLGKNYGAFIELETAGGEVEVVNHFTGVFGKEDNYKGFRVGLMHWLLRGSAAGFDRPTGIATPTPLSGKLTKGALPFTFSTDQLGLEGFWVSGKNRFSAEVLNGINAAGSGGGGGDLAKDFVLIDQYLLDDNGSGITAVAYFGQLVGADPKAASVKSKFTRFAISANKIYKQTEVMAGYVSGQDSDLPVVTGGAFTASSVKGTGFWVYGGYTAKDPNLTLFSRYEFVNPNRDVAKAGTSRFVLGTVLPFSLPEYLRFAAEYTLDIPQATGSFKKHGFTAELMINF